MNNDPTSIWAGLCLAIAGLCYAAGYSRRAMQEEERRRTNNSRRKCPYLEKL